MKLKFTKDKNNKFHKGIWYGGDLISISLSIFWMKALGIYFKKDGSSFNIYFDFIILSFHFHFWDREWNKLLKRK